VDLELRDGEIHALLGENGAGKSTLIKALAGAIARDAGSIAVGEKVLPHRHTPQDVRDAGIAFVHQDLALFNDLSVAENIALSIGYGRPIGLISHGATERAVKGWLDKVGATFDPAEMVGRLAQDEKVLCALARAFASSARIVVLDEVSASLPAPEMDRLASAFQAAKRTGVAYIYVTHRLQEVFQFADRVTVLRDGRVSICAPISQVTPDEIVTHILGKSHIVHQRKSGARSGARARLEVMDLQGPGLSAPVSFDVAAGEVLAICGLVGSGTRAIARLIGGAENPSDGGAKLEGRQLSLGAPRRLSMEGCAYIPGDRLQDGVFSDLTVRENLFPLRRWGARKKTDDAFIRWTGSERKSTLELMQRFEVRPSNDAEIVLSDLSGGNQQKVVFGRALRTQQKLLVLEDPTSGVDIGSRAVLHNIIRDAAVSGTVVLLISTDFEEVATQADRALIMCDGRIVAEIMVSELAEDVAEEALARASYGTEAPDQERASVP
jgi:ribose transport system ATP-binding protein